ncbi:hypothetical protein AAC387_Pa05g3035 [Persea americana]
MVQIPDQVGHVVPQPQTTQIDFDVLELEKPSSDLDSLLDCELLPLEAIAKNHTNSRESKHQILPNENEFYVLNPLPGMTAGVLQCGEIGCIRAKRKHGWMQEEKVQVSAEIYDMRRQTAALW